MCAADEINLPFCTNRRNTRQPTCSSDRVPVTEVIERHPCLSFKLIFAYPSDCVHVAVAEAPQATNVPLASSGLTFLTVA